MVRRITKKLTMMMLTAARLTTTKELADFDMVPSNASTPPWKFFSVYFRMVAKLSRAFMALGVISRSYSG